MRIPLCCLPHVDRLEYPCRSLHERYLPLVPGYLHRSPSTMVSYMSYTGNQDHDVCAGCCLLQPSGSGWMQEDSPDRQTPTPDLGNGTFPRTFDCPCWLTKIHCAPSLLILAEPSFVSTANGTTFPWLGGPHGLCSMSCQ